MPVIVVNLKQKYFSQIQRLIAEGQYSSPGEFVALATANQLELESEHANPIEEFVQPVSEVVERVIAVRKEPKQSGEPRAPIQSIPKAAGGQLDSDEIRKVIARLAAPSRELESAFPEAAPATETGLEVRIWGQVNRIFPMKVALAWMAAKALSEGSWSATAKILDAVSNDAATLGSALQQSDDDASRQRHNVLATALPRAGNPQSLTRFSSQFLARTTVRGATHAGACVQFGLALIDGGQIRLTREGLKFACLPNPIFRASDFTHVDATLSPDEREFFVRHAVPLVPTELEDYRLVIDTIQSGENSPTDQITHLSTRLPSDWSDTQIRTHVTGVVARMVDLGLLRRVRNGRHVHYETTNLVAVLAQRR